jgi:geranylgeranyl reductase family protein
LERFDVLVAGAGPAGSVTAYRLARAGARVLLADRARFPRDKPCGGGVTLRALRELPIDIEPVVEEVVDRFEVRLEYRRRFVRGGDGPLCLLTQRRRLDAHLAAEAAAAGAEFRDGVKVDEIELDDDGVTATVGGDRVRAKVLVGADGANGVTARALGLDGREIGVALEGNCGYDRVDRDRYAGRLVLEVGIVPGGYGWAFPKGDHVNFGIGGWEREGPRLRDHLRRLCAAHGVDVGELSDLRGFRLPMRRPDSGLVRGRALLVGDAAGLVDPLSGDGMYEAFVSARLASQAILDLFEDRACDLEPYAHATIAALGTHAAASWSAKVALDRFPRLAFVVAPLVWPTVARLVRGEMEHPGQARGLARPPLRVLRRMAIRAGDRGAAFRAALPQS